MKTLLLLLAGITLAVCTQGQTIDQYKATAEKLIRYYNKADLDSFNLLFAHPTDTKESLRWLNDTLRA
jgi:hypothetical protein